MNQYLSQGSRVAIYVSPKKEDTTWDKCSMCSSVGEDTQLEIVSPLTGIDQK